jgi:phosphoribosylanthranilate isomerase
LLGFLNRLVKNTMIETTATNTATSLSNTPRIKCCGFTRQQDLDAAVALEVDYVGFVFYAPSPRYIAPNTAAALVASLPARAISARAVIPVGLFVNHDAATVREAVLLSGIKILQFHGLESPQLCEQLSQDLGLPYWKAIHVAPDSTPDSLLKLCQTYSTAQAVLFDTAIAPLNSEQNQWGGTGHTFEWQTLLTLSAQDAHVPPLVLSGGLNAQNVTQGIQLLKPWAVDVSSGIEAIDVATNTPRKGIKNADLMAHFVAAVRGN